MPAAGIVMQRVSVRRRELLFVSAAAGLAATLGPVAAAQAVTAPHRVPGIQLYTVRAAMATDVAATLQAIAGIGYREVEFAGYFDHSAGRIRALLDRFGMRAPSTHMDARALRDDPQRLIDTAAEIGHDYVTIAWLNPDDRRASDDYRRWADTFNRVGEKCRASGLRFAYHNHDFEFMGLDGEVPFNLLLDGTEPDLVSFELDFFWARKAGRRIPDVLKQAPARFTMSHIKDMDAAGDMADVGRGTIDFAGILADTSSFGIRHCFVEHDAPPDPFQSAAYSHFALKSILD